MAELRLAVVRGAIVLLALVGVLAGAVRTRRALLERSPAAGTTARLAREDSVVIAWFAAGGRIAPGTPRYDELARDTYRNQRKYAAYPAATLLHVMPGTIFMLLAPLQLVRWIRSRYPRVHRWSGRLLLVCGASIAASAFFFAWFHPIVAWREAAVITTVGGFFVVTGIRAFAAIRRRDVASHREWMLRFLAGGVAISMVRLVSFPVMILWQMSSADTLVVAMVIGWAITWGVAEWWIRRTRLTPAPSPRFADAVTALS